MELPSFILSLIIVHSMIGVSSQQLSAVDQNNKVNQDVVSKMMTGMYNSTSCLLIHLEQNDLTILNLV